MIIPCNFANFVSRFSNCGPDRLRSLEVAEERLVAVEKQELKLAVLKIDFQNQ